MKIIKVVNIILLFSLLFIQCTTKIGEISKSNTSVVGPQPDGSILVPTNQLLRPAGFQIQFQGRPVDLALTLLYLT